MDAIVQANYTESDREVLIPANCTFHTFPIWAEDITNLTITIDGTIKASKRHHRWPNKVDSKGKVSIRDLLYFKEVHDFTIRGTGTVDG